MSSLGRIITILLAIILILFLPLQYIAQLQVDTMDHIVEAHTHEFTDSVRQKGSITLEDYEGYFNKINQTKEIYSIEIEHAIPKTLSDLTLNIQEDTRLASNGLSLVPDINRFKEEHRIFSLSTHTHVAACYDGDMHSHSGSSSSGSGCYGSPVYRYHEHSSSCKHVHTSSCDKTENCAGGRTKYDSLDARYHYHTVNKVVTRVDYYKCSTCGRSLGSITYNYAFNCSTCGDSGSSSTSNNVSSCSTKTTTKICGMTTSTNVCGKTTSTREGVSYYNMNCGKSSGTYYKGSTIVSPTCNTVVTSIRAKYPSQTVDIGEPINTTAIATYLDGHEGEVNCSSNYNPNKGGSQTVTLTYSGKVDNAKTNGSKASTINVTVIDKIVTSIVVTPSSQTIERYENPTFIIRAHYDDGTINIVDNYTISTFYNKNIGKQIVTFLYTENNVTVTTSVEVTVTNLSKLCTECGARYELDNNDIDNGCPNCASIITKIEAVSDLVTVNQGSTLPITVYGIYKNGGKALIDNWTSNYEPLRLGYQQVTISYGDYKAYITVHVLASKTTCAICGNEYQLNDNGSDAGCPVCSTTVISIKAEPNPIIIEKHQPLNLIVIATYRDGHMEEVTDWSTDFIPDRAGTFESMIYYKSVSCPITINVMDSNLIQCPYCGLQYNLSEFPFGCPVCSVTIMGIEASLRNGSSKVIKGSKLDVEILIEFKDAHKEMTYSGYTISNYNPDILGEQTVTVHYKGYDAQLNIEVIEQLAKNTCPNGHIYHLNEDGSDPGCPYCIDDGEREKTLVYYDIIYTTEIIETLYNQNVYQMKTGDYITIVVTKKNKSLRSQIIKIFNYSKEINNSISYGGEVIDG